MPTPTYVVQHTYLGEGPAQMHRRPIIMMANRFEDNPREADCSGRALATLVIAWVGAALVASVLLKWTHMWVALAVLTLLFLVACGYAACEARRTQERAFVREAERQLERRRRREQQLQSVSGGIDNFPEILDPPEYQTYWVADLPPSYTTVVRAQTESVTNPTTPEAEEVPGSSPVAGVPRFSNPPPYAIAVQSEPLYIPIVQQTVGVHSSEINSMSQIPTNGQNLILQTSTVENGQTSSHNQHQTGIRIPPSICSRDQDKTDEENVRNDMTNTPQQQALAVTPSRAQYLTSILMNSTFGRNIRRSANDNLQEQNNNAGGIQTTNSTSTERQINNNGTVNSRRRSDGNGVDQVNNNDRNNNNNNNNNHNNFVGPPPAYPVTRLPSD